ncbi:MAG TPA: hypothetical protein DHN33_02945 [Eubacteriaceae bacterium]|nr:hypothetical protein [Eubacteriaceae bacterium]
MAKKWIWPIRIGFFLVFLGFLMQGKMNLWLGVFLVTVFLATFFGRFYCGYICPMNTVMVPIGKVARRLHIQKADVPKWASSSVGQWIVLFLMLGTMLGGRRLLGRESPVLHILLVIAGVVTLRYHERFFHNGLCPFGLLQSFTGKYARYRKQVDKEKCIGCKKCEKVCPSAAIAVTDKKAKIDPKLCHQCTNCPEVCPTKAIGYGKV